MVISGYAPSRATLKDNSTIIIIGEYPFSDKVEIEIDDKIGGREIRLRIPCWVTEAFINEEKSDSCTFFSLKLPNNPGKSIIKIDFVNKIELFYWNWANSTASGAVEVHRGPLTYALRPNSTIET